MEGMYRVTDRGNGKTLANVKVEYRDNGAYVSVQWFGKGEWEEDPEAFGLLLGEFGEVSKVD